MLPNTLISCSLLLICFKIKIDSSTQRAETFFVPQKCSRAKLDVIGL